MFKPPSAPGFASTTWPTEHADTWRTHAVAAGLPAGLRHMTLRAVAAKLPPVPVWGYTGKRPNIYVVGGAPYLLDMFTKLLQGAPRASIPLLTLKSKACSQTVTPYVARINTNTMKVKVLALRRGTSANYTGGLLALWARPPVAAHWAPRRNAERRWSKTGPLHGQAQNRRSPGTRRPAKLDQ